MAYNRTEIMKRAWIYARQDQWSQRLPASALRSVFCKSLAYAWKEAKTKAVRAAETAKALVGMVVRSVSKIRDAIISLECQDRLTHADWLFMATLKAELAEAQRRENPALAA